MLIMNEVVLSLKEKTIQHSCILLSNCLQVLNKFYD